MSARPPRSAAALLAALCLLLITATADASVRHHRAHAAGKRSHLMASFSHGTARLGRQRRRTARHPRRRPATATTRPVGGGRPGSGSGSADGSASAGAPAALAGTSPAALAAAAARPEPRFGVFTDGAPYAGDVGAIDRLQAGLGRRVDIVNWYQNWGQTPGADWVSNVHADVIGAVTRSARTPLLTWEPWDPAAGADQPAYRLRRIAGGDYDAYIGEWADALAATGSEIYLRPMHEFNGDWYPWGAGQGDNSPRLYVQAWRRMHDVFAAHGATNVRWVWCPVPVSVPDTPANAIERYYPGGEYVDVLALDGYNWGSSRPEYGGWQSFSQVFRDAYDRLTALGPQPVWVAEVGSAPDGGDKAAWVRDMWATARTWPRLKAIVWFDQDKEEDWRALPVAPAFAAG